MEVIPALVARLKPYLQLEPTKLIRTYFNSIRFAIHFLTFCEFKDIFPKEFKVFYKSLDKNALKSQIKETILDNIDYYLETLIPRDEVKVDMLLDFYIDDIFKEYRIRKSKRFMEAAFGMADRNIHFSEKEDIKEKNGETRIYPTLGIGDPDALFRSLRPNLRRGTYFQAKPNEIQKNGMLIDKKLVTTHIKRELSDDKSVKEVLDKILSKGVYRDFLENPGALSVLTNYLIQGLPHPENAIDLYLDILSWMLLNKKPKTSIKLGLDIVKRILAEVAFTLSLNNMWWFKEEQVVSLLNELKEKYGYTYNSKELLSQLEQELSILFRDGIWYTFLIKKIHYFFSALYISTLPNCLKQNIYENEFREISQNVMKEDFTPNDFWELVEELDEHKFYSYCAIPLSKKLGIVKRIVGRYELFLREISNLENQYLTGEQ